MTVTNPSLPLYAAEIERTCVPLERATQLPGAALRTLPSLSGNVPTCSRVAGSAPVTLNKCRSADSTFRSRSGARACWSSATTTASRAHS